MGRNLFVAVGEHTYVRWEQKFLAGKRLGLCIMGWNDCMNRVGDQTIQPSGLRNLFDFSWLGIIVMMLVTNQPDYCSG
jgi:hypothetical protein